MKLSIAYNMARMSGSFRQTDCFSSFWDKFLQTGKTQILITPTLRQSPQQKSLTWVSLKLFLVFGQTMRRFRLHAFGLIVYLALALLRVALVNFTLNEYMTMMRLLPKPPSREVLA